MMNGSPSSFVQHYEFLDGFLQPLQCPPDEQVRKKNAMSKRGQKTISNEGSPMAKARPFLVAREQRTEEISARSLGSLVNPENADE